MQSKRLIILVGIPTAGKSTWTEKFIKSHPGAQSVSRDEIRFKLFGKDYDHTSKNEKFVTNVFDKTVDTLMENDTPYIILDNTHCKESYISQAMDKYMRIGYQVQFKFFDIPMWKAYYRNIKRYLGTGKWIPIDVIKRMKVNYDQIDKQYYHEEYMVLQ